jgi:outer membrane protein OmpA-like peptidoglycan-associated protein
VNAEHEQQARDNEQRETRSRLLGQLNGIASTRDTAFGLVVTIPDAGFTGTVLRNSIEDQVARVSRILIAHPALRVEVQGHSDSPETEAEASRRAQAVGDTLIRRGLASATVSVRSLGDSRLLGPNATPHGREENRRVEIVVSGDEIGSMALWDHTYTLTHR